MKTKLYMAMCGVLAAFSFNSVAVTKPGNFVSIKYKGEQIVEYGELGGARKLMEIPRLLHSISNNIDSTERELATTLKDKFAPEMPSGLRLNSTHVSFNHVFELDLRSQGGGRFSLDFQGLPMRAKAYIRPKVLPGLGEAVVSINTGYLSATGNYNLWTGISTVNVNPISFDASLERNGLGLKIVNWITAGRLDDVLDEYERAGIEDIQDEIDSIVNQEIVLNSNSIFGLGDFLTDELLSNYPNISPSIRNKIVGEIRNLVDDIPAGKILSTRYLEYNSKYKAKLTVTIGSDLEIVLDHWNPNGTCTGRCRT